MFLSGILIFALLSNVANCELFSSTEDLKALADNHGKFIRELRSFVSNLESDLAFAKW